LLARFRNRLSADLDVHRGASSLSILRDSGPGRCREATRCRYIPSHMTVPQWSDPDICEPNVGKVSPLTFDMVGRLSKQMRMHLFGSHHVEGRPKRCSTGATSSQVAARSRSQALQ